MTQSNDSQSTHDLIAHTLKALRAVYADLTKLNESPGGIAALANTASGTALLHDLRLEVNQLNRLLPFKG